MEIIKITKKFKNACYDVMDNKEGSLQALEKFREKFPHQVDAILAEVAYFDGDFQKALDIDLMVLPWLDEWRFSNVKNEHISAMTTAALQTHREAELIKIFENEIERIQNEGSDKSLIKYINKMIESLNAGMLPCFHVQGSGEFEQAENPKTREELWEKIKADDKKIQKDTADGRRTLFTHCRIFGFPKDALDLFEERAACNDDMSELDYIVAVQLYKLFEQFDEAMKMAEQISKDRLWHVASPTQVRPMSFFLQPTLCPYLLEKESLERIKNASFMYEGDRFDR